MIISAITNGLLGPPINRQAPIKTTKIRRTVENQCRIGWEPFLLGRFSVIWRRIAEKYYKWKAHICRASAGYVH